jgi:putative transposase
MFVTLCEPHLLWRAVDEHGAELDILLQKRRDKASAKRFFKRVLPSSPVPRKIVTDQLRSYPAANAEIPELANVKHVFVKATARLNNRAENGHQPTRERERRMRGFRDPKRTQKLLSCFGPIRQHFTLKRHLLRASLYRKQLAAAFVAWRELTEVTQGPSYAFCGTLFPAVFPPQSGQVGRAPEETIKEAMSYLCVTAMSGCVPLGKWPRSAALGFESGKIPDISVSTISTNVHGLRQQISHFHQR